jgi:NAD(P)-dependent dehydrogenase (short-subunit alcohol dehydrogenase family)
MAKLLEGKVAIITGAGRGLGKDEALYLAKEGAIVVINDIGAGFDGAGNATGPADDVVKEIKAAGGEAMSSYASVADYKAMGQLIQDVAKKYGKMNIVVNNAGILRDRMIFNMAEEDWDLVMQVHMKGTFNLCRHACVYWREQHKAGNKLNGRLINTVSDAGLLGNAGQSNYGAAKGGIAAFSNIIAMEMVKYGVTVNCVAPNARTRLTTDATPQFAAFMQAPETGFDKFNPSNMAPLVAYLASDKAADINGEAFRLIGNNVWLLRGWRSEHKYTQAKQEQFSIAELDKGIHEMIAKTPPKEPLAASVMSIG